jgi:carboxyl-terminal processing protease
MLWLRFLVVPLGVGIAFATSSPARAGDARGDFERAREAILSGYVDPALTEEALYRKALRGMLSGLDPRHPEWNRLYSPAEYRDLQAELSGRVVGIGVQIALDAPTGFVLIQEVLAGAPAQKAGLKAGDRILQIDGKSVEGMALGAVVALLRGDAGSTVALTYLRAGAVSVATPVREPIAIASVQTQTSPDGTRVIAISSLDDTTAGGLQAALEQTPAPVGIVLDLRGNPGGALSAMTAVAGELLPDGTVVAYSVDREGKRTPLAAQGKPVLPAAPLAVLIDHRTSCGAEVLAEALRSTLGAVIVGERTLGKWNTQTIEELPDQYAMRYTVARLLGPHGEAFDGIGISPDITTASTGAHNPTVARALSLLKGG